MDCDRISAAPADERDPAHQQAFRWEFGAGRENRTLILSLEDCGSAFELHPQSRRGLEPAQPDIWPLNGTCYTPAAQGNKKSRPLRLTQLGQLLKRTYHG